MDGYFHLHSLSTIEKLTLATNDFLIEKANALSDGEGFNPGRVLCSYQATKLVHLSHLYYTGTPNHHCANNYVSWAYPSHAVHAIK